MQQKFRKTMILVIIFIVFLGVVIYSIFMPHNSLSFSLPPAVPISNQTQLTCEGIVSSYVAANSPCFSPGIKAGVRKREVQNYSVSTRNPNTNEWTTRNDYRKTTINLRIDGNQALISGDIPIHSDKPFTININNQKNLTASLIINETLATGSATLVLDKTRGFLTLIDNSTQLYCQDSLVTQSTLYQCK